MNKFTNQIDFPTKKAAKEAGFRTRQKWFANFRVPKAGELPTMVKGDEFFSIHQTEEVYSRSKGQREIGRLLAESQPVGVKRLPRRSVKYEVFRESDFVYEPKKVYHRNVTPPCSIDLLDAIRKIASTAAKFEAAAKQANKRNDRRRGRGFRNRGKKLMELVELGMRRAIVLERVDYVGSRGSCHRYIGGGFEFRSRVVPPKWMKRVVQPAAKVHDPKTRVRGRLKDAVWTIEKFRGDPTIDW